MTTLTLDTRYINILQDLGDPNEILEEALRRYTTEQIGERVGLLQHKILALQTKYGLPYEQFYTRVNTDQEFAENLRQTQPSWERDLNAWRRHIEKLAKWLGYLERISRP